jgi:hypothetical protein
VAGVSDLPIVRFSGFVASYAKTFLASAAASVWAATGAQTANTLANNEKVALIYLWPASLIPLTPKAHYCYHKRIRPLKADSALFACHRSAPLINELRSNADFKGHPIDQKPLASRKWMTLRVNSSSFSRYMR